MTTTPEGPSPPRRRPGPKPHGRTVVSLTITVTPAQRAALETRADAERSTISEIVRRFIAAGLASGASVISVSSCIAFAVAHRRCAPKGAI